MQELGSDLSGTAKSFTFRVSTSVLNRLQFEYTGLNSRIYDKDNSNSYVKACPSIPSPLTGLTFNTSGVPAGYEDVTMDFSCRNFTFIKGHRYIMYITNANTANSSGMRIRFATTRLGISGIDKFTGGGLRYAFDNLSCSPENYKWNSQTANSGCNILTSPKDDLYFSLTNTAPTPKTAVIFIPGIGGSELKINQNTPWSGDNAHNGNYSHTYSKDEKIWVNQDEAVKLGNDDYFDVLRLNNDGKTSMADISINGNLTPLGYGDIDPFFTELGYEKNKNYFVFPYDWRKDVRENKTALDALIDLAIQNSGVNRVNIVAHSMGGLIARHYISDSNKAPKVNLLIELGVPHLGAVSATKSIMYGQSITYKIPFLSFLTFSVIPSSEIKDLFANLSSAYQLLPSNKYFDFYNDSTSDTPYPFFDSRNIDNNEVTDALNYTQTKDLLSNLGHNMTVYNIAEDFHTNLDQTFSNTNGVNTYIIAGSGQPTLGQIKETSWITWPSNIISKTEEVYINGDDTVPLYSASLKNDSTNISGAIKIYYADQTHGDLVSKNGTAMQTVKSILANYDLPVLIKSAKIILEGDQISLDDGEIDLYDENNNHTGIKDNSDEIETNIPNTYYASTGNSKNIFIKKQNKNIKIKITKKDTSLNLKKTNIKINRYTNDKVSKTIVFKDVPLSENSKIEFSINTNTETPTQIISYPDLSKIDSQTIDSTLQTANYSDLIPPVTKTDITGTKNISGEYDSPVTITLSSADAGSGILKTEYSLDNGLTIQTYTEPFVINTPGNTTLLVSSTDKSGNQEMPVNIGIGIYSQTIAVVESSQSAVSNPSPTPTPTPQATSTPTSSPNSISGSSQTTAEPSPSATPVDNFITSADIPSDPKIAEKIEEKEAAVLGTNSGTNTPAPNKILEHLDPKPQIQNEPISQKLSGLLMGTTGIVIVASALLAFSFFKPPHK